MNNSSKLLQACSDGSFTMYSPQFDETFHSIHGALQESNHVFIEAGLAPFLQKKELTIFEMGFGTGLNAFLTCQRAWEANCKIKYITIDAYPLNERELQLISSQQNMPVDEQYVEQILQAQWNEETKIHDYFQIVKINQKLEEIELEAKVDLIYFDAFSPRTQPELWTVEIFTKLYKHLHDSGVLVTYCAKGQVKRNMKAAGFVVEALPGPKGKREMTRARK